MNFDIAFDRLIGHEGGYTSGGNDPGGETKWGISKRAYPKLDIKSLTREQAKEIYRIDYWGMIGAPALSPAIAYQVFDCAVNSGVETALRMLEMTHSSDDMKTIILFNAERLAYMTNLGAWLSFGRGWARRITANLRYGLDDL